MRKAQNLATRLDRLHAEMVAQQERRFTEFEKNLQSLSSIEFFEYLRELYFTAIVERDATFIEFFEKEGLQWLLQDNWKEERARRCAFQSEDIA